MTDYGRLEGDPYPLITILDRKLLYLQCRKKGLSGSEVKRVAEQLTGQTGRTEAHKEHYEAVVAFRLIVYLDRYYTGQTDMQQCSGGAEACLLLSIRCSRAQRCRNPQSPPQRGDCHGSPERRPSNRVLWSQCPGRNRIRDSPRVRLAIHCAYNYLLGE